MSYWRIHNLINAELSKTNGAYLEIGSLGGVNLRKIRGKRIVGISDYGLKKGETKREKGIVINMSVDRFFENPNRLERKFDVVYLRDRENLGEQIKTCLEYIVEPGGLLIVEGVCLTGRRNDSWRVVAAMKRKKMDISVINGYYLVCRNNQGEIKGELHSGMKLEKFKKEIEKSNIKISMNVGL